MGDEYQISRAALETAYKILRVLARRKNGRLRVRVLQQKYRQNSGNSVGEALAYLVAGGWVEHYRVISERQGPNPAWAQITESGRAAAARGFRIPVHPGDSDGEAA